MFEVRSAPNWHSIGTYLVRTKPPITFVIVIFLWGQMVGVIFICKNIPLVDKDLRFCQFESFDCGIVHLVQIGHGYPGRPSSCTSSSAGWRCSIPSVSVRSSFLYIVVRNGKEAHRVLDEFLILLSSFPQEVPARAVDDANVSV